MTRHPGKAPSQRQLRVGEELRHALAEVLERGEIHDPDVAGRSVTVTEVSVSPDLKNATVFVMPLGGGDVERVLAGLRRAKSFLRHELSRRVRMRVVPNMSFEPDRSFEHAGRIDALLHQPEVARDLPPHQDQGQDQNGGDDGA